MHGPTSIISVTQLGRAERDTYLLFMPHRHSEHCNPTPLLIVPVGVLGQMWFSLLLGSFWAAMMTCNCSTVIEFRWMALPLFCLHVYIVRKFVVSNCFWKKFSMWCISVCFCVSHCLLVTLNAIWQTQLHGLVTFMGVLWQIRSFLPRSAAAFPLCLRPKIELNWIGDFSFKHRLKLIVH